MQWEVKHGDAFRYESDIVKGDSGGQFEKVGRGITWLDFHH